MVCCSKVMCAVTGNKNLLLFYMASLHKNRVIYKEIFVLILMIDHWIFARSNAILSDRQYYLRRFSENSTRSRWSSKQILFDHMRFCSIIWSRIDLINDPGHCRVPIGSDHTLHPKAAKTYILCAIWVHTALYNSLNRCTVVAVTQLFAHD